MDAPCRSNLASLVAAEVYLDQLMDEGRILFRRGCFGELAASLPDPDHFSAPLFPPHGLSIAGYIRRIATFYGAWDQLDYPCAARHADFGPAPPGAGHWQRLVPAPEVADWVRRLAAEDGGDPERWIQYMRDLTVDLFACGERRLAQGRFPEAVQNGYAVMEKIAHVRLRLHGAEKSKGLQDGLGTLAGLRDPLVRPLRDLRLRIFGRRNQLVRNHGTKTVGSEDKEALAEGYRLLEQLVLADRGEAAQRSLWVARAPQRVVAQLPADQGRAKVTVVDRTSCHGATPWPITCFLN